MSSSAGEQDGPPADGRPTHAPWAWYLAACALGIAAYFALPSATSQNVAFIASSLVGAAAILTGVHRQRPPGAAAWRLLAAYGVCTAAGNGIWLLYDSVLHIEPFPSPGDALFLGGYLVEAAGLMALIRRRSPGRDRAALTDAAIITTGFGVAAWVFLMSPLARDPSLTLLGRLTSLGYPACDLLVLLIGARLFAGRATGAPAFRLLGATLVIQLLADTAFALLNLAGTYHTGHPVDALILAYNLGLGAAALHPSMRTLCAPLPPLSPRVAPRRLALLTATSLMAPGLLLAQTLTHHDADLAVTAAGGVVLFLLVLLRMTGLVRMLDRTLASRQALQEELEHLVRHDPLTGLANRRLLAERLRALADAPGAGPVALLYVDLDDFKQVNDRLGHDAGDAVLTAVGRRLRECARSTDTAARLGGDEFALLLPGTTTQDAQRVAARVLDALREPIATAGGALRLGASIGVAAHADRDAADRLLRHADGAMYQAKHAGKSTFRVLDATAVG